MGWVRASAGLLRLEGSAPLLVRDRPVISRVHYVDQPWHVADRYALFPESLRDLLSGQPSVFIHIEKVEGILERERLVREKGRP